MPSGPSAPQQTARLLGGLPVLHNSRQPDCKGGATPGLAGDGDVAAHHLAKPPADYETKAGATVFTGCRGRGLGKLLEQLGHLLCRHANAGIRHRQRDPIVAVLLMLTGIDRNVPRSVNLLALLMRFNNAWRRRIWSACIVPIPESHWTATLLEFLAARGSIVLMTSAISGASANDERASSLLTFGIPIIRPPLGFWRICARRHPYFR